MSRKHSLVISVLLGACVVTGASAALKTTHLGQAGKKADLTPTSVIEARRAKLGLYEASLQKALRAKTPALPAVPRFAPVSMPVVASAPVAATAPTTAPDPTVTSPPPTTTTPPAAPAQPAPVIQYAQPTVPTTGQGGDDEHEGDDSGGVSEGSDG
jgi:hypothetical protein